MAQDITFADDKPPTGKPPLCGFCGRRHSLELTCYEFAWEGKEPPKACCQGHGEHEEEQGEPFYIIFTADKPLIGVLEIIDPPMLSKLIGGPAEIGDEITWEKVD